MVDTVWLGHVGLSFVATTSPATDCMSTTAIYSVVVRRRPSPTLVRLPSTSAATFRGRRCCSEVVTHWERSIRREAERQRVGRRYRRRRLHSAGCEAVHTCEIREAPLPQTDRATRHASRNRVNCRTVIGTSKISGKKHLYQKQLDPSIRFDATPACDRRTDGHKTTAYTALA